MNKNIGIYEAFSPDKNVVLIKYDGDEKGSWIPANEKVMEVLKNTQILSKGDQVEITTEEAEDGKETITFLKKQSGNKTGGFKKPFKTGEDLDRIMRQNAMNRVVELVVSKNLPFDTTVMEEAANGFLAYFKTGELTLPKSK
jgi:hypothetical protein